MRATPAGPTVPFVGALAAFGDRLALVSSDASLSYRELDERVAEVAARLGRDDRRLVLVGAVNRIEAIVAYLGALAGGHVVLLGDADDARGMATLADRFNPDVILAPSGVGGAWAANERHGTSAHDLHPELALLMRTSGSTGSPKLVRLSHENLQSNAGAIAAYLDIGTTDRAATTLPIHYSYGLSVVHSHLASGASLLVSDLSVVDRCFWEQFRAGEATSFAGVPYTFDLLDRVGFADMDLPSLRYVTQAGGRLSPDRVRAYAELGRQRGWQLYVMYGQTEATARIAYLPPELAVTRPHAVGVPIPGVSLRLDPVPDAPGDARELVLSGPNVMLGYAEHPVDLRRGRDIDELRTGDLARETEGGLYELVGRRSAFIKIAGLRVDLGQVERNLEAMGVVACCSGRDEQVVVAVQTDADESDIRPVVLEAVALPAHAVHVLALSQLPRRANGKPDRARVLELADEAAAAPTDAPSAGPTTDVRDVTGQTSDGAPAPVRALYAEHLDREVTEDDSFASLGGDSLSYVQVSLGLEEIVGRLPEAWPTMRVAVLERLALERNAVPKAPRVRGTTTDAIRGSRLLRRLVTTFALRSVETTIALRAVAIVLIVSTHAGLINVMGGAHVLLAVAGYNFARFQLTEDTPRARLWSQLRSIARIVVPTVAWIAVALVITDDYALHNLFLLNPIVGPPPFTSTWHFWFVELLVYILVAMAAVLAIPAIDRVERRWPFLVAIVVLGLGLSFRSGLLEFGILQSRPVLWLFALGWAAYRVQHTWQRALVLAVAVTAVPGFYLDPQREIVILAGIVLLVVARSVRVPAFLVRPAGLLASASLFIYLVHWQVYPHLAQTSELLAVAVSLVLGSVAWRLGVLAEPALIRAIRRRRTSGTLPMPRAAQAPLNASLRES